MNTQTEIRTPSPSEARRPEAQKCVTIIFNPVSGKTDPEQRKKIISDTLAEHGYTYQYLETTKQEGAKALAEKAASKGIDLLAVSGGDGTVMEVLSALVGTNIPVAVLPAGTGNLLSVNLGIPMTVPEAVHVALSGRPYALDLAKTGDDRYFAILGGMGLDAAMIHDADRKTKDKFGVLAYFVAAVKNLPRRRSRVSLRLDGGEPISHHAKSVVIANMGKITGGLEAIPTASPDDGKLDVGILKAETLAQWLRLLGYAVLGRTHEAPDFDVYQARHIVLETSFPEPIQFDGEDGGRARKLTVEIVPKAVLVMLPEDAPAAQDTPQTPDETARRNALRPLLLIAGGLVLTGLVAWAIRRRRG
ncbi:MAG: diacylglycerol kinase family lipid kinase [Armatimonadota bacterium]|nr:diacylglycerol kinase family lipid kinase [Armatimonadota bacterium]